MAEQDQDLVSRVGPIEVDWPRTFGYFGGAAIAVAAGMIEAPLGVAIAAVPFVKMLNNGRLPSPSRFVGQLFEGAAKPIGGDAEGTIRFAPAKPASPRRTRTRRTADSPSSKRARRSA